MSALAFELITRVTALGMRFRDEATGRAVPDGLAVTATGVPAITNPSGVFVFHGLPGMGDTERGAGDSAFWSSPPEVLPYEIQVGDPRGRFAPFSFTAQAPHRGLFDLPCAWLSPPSSPPGPDAAPAVPLFSSPARPPEPAMAVVRAEIREAAGDRPAAFALLEVDAGPGGPSGRSFADAHGRVLVMFPYPPPPSGLGVTSHSIENATWTVNIRVWYAPASVAAIYGPPPLGTPYPDLCDVLGQPPATPLATAVPAVPMSTRQLAFGRELLLATAGRNVLLVT